MRETYATFHEAARRAKAAAIESQVSVSLERTTSGWSVEVPLACLPNREDEENDDEMDVYMAEAQQDVEVQEEIWEEISSDQEDWQRSEEEGWYYGDED